MNISRRELGAAAAAAAFALGPSARLRPPARAQTSSPDERAKMTEQRMTDDERFSLLVSVMGANLTPAPDPRIPPGVVKTAGYTPGVPRLGVPALRSTDAGQGMVNPGDRPGDKGATALPASIVVGASFNATLAREYGALLGREARIRGFNIVLGGGINLQRDPRNGRNFECYSEDPLLSAVLGAETVRGTQGEAVISTLKHYSLNCNETNRRWLDALIDPAAHRESDLLAFQMAIERSQPGSIMTGYNKVNGEYASGNSHLLNDILKGAWGYRGWVMSDWGATASWDFALNGLDQESGAQIDDILWKAEPFTGPLRQAYTDGKLPKERLSDMVRRILTSTYTVGIDQWGPAPKVDAAMHNAVALEIARQGIVVLKNDELLPLATDTNAKIAVIGGHAQEGVPTGTGSSAVVPGIGYAAVVKIGGPGPMGIGRNLCLLPSSPFAELKRLLPNAQVDFDPGRSPAEAALLALRSDVVIVFGTRAEGDGFDLPDLSLPWGQDAVISAVAAANSKTVVVLETGNPVRMPWHNKVKAIVQAWYPGQAGGQAIAEVLTGVLNPSGRLPLTFPAGLAQTPRPRLSGLGTAWGTPTTIRYAEGAEVGYRWFAKERARPLYAFGHGLSYTHFIHENLAVHGGETVAATFTVTNSGAREGADVPQLYLTDAAGDKRMRLIGFDRVVLKPGESKSVTVAADPRLLGRFDENIGRWRIAAGRYRVALGMSAEDLRLHAEVQLAPRVFGT